MGAPRKYEDPGKLERAVEKYFKSITREIRLTENKPTGQKDKDGHMIYEQVEIINGLGKPVTVTEYIVPPSVFDLCEFLKISESTWNNYCDPQKHPEFLGTITRTRGRMRAWNEQQLLTRSGKDLKGIIFNLENNYGYKERLDVSNESMESFLQRQLEEGTGGQEF